MALIGDPIREVEYAPLEGPLVEEAPEAPELDEAELEHEEVVA